MAIIIAVVMILYSGGKPIEYVYHDGIASCLKQKREIQRYGWKDAELNRYSCEKRRIELQLDSEQVLRLVD